MRARRISMLCLALIILGVNLQSCSSVQQIVQGTPTFTPTITLTSSPTFTPTSTLTPTRTPIPTITPNLAATQRYEAFISLVQASYDSGQISSMDGEYVKLNNFYDSLARSYGYSWRATGVNARDFIVRADFEWEVANLKSFSGCGFVFRDNGERHYLLGLDALNGTLLMRTYINVYNRKVHENIAASRKSKLPDMDAGPYKVTFTLVVNDYKAYTYIDDIFYSEYNLIKDTLDWSGALSFMVLTGSETDFGTRCEITNAEAWIISP